MPCNCDNDNDRNIGPQRLVKGKTTDEAITDAENAVKKPTLVPAPALVSAIVLVPLSRLQNPRLPKPKKPVRTFL